MLDIKPLGAVFYILDLFPGTALYEDFKRRCNVTDDTWLERVEDIMYFETDPNLSMDLILEFGRWSPCRRWRKDCRITSKMSSC